MSGNTLRDQSVGRSTTGYGLVRVKEGCSATNGWREFEFTALQPPGTGVKLPNPGNYRAYRNGLLTKSSTYKASGELLSEETVNRSYSSQTNGTLAFEHLGVAAMEDPRFLTHYSSIGNCDISQQTEDWCSSYADINQNYGTINFFSYLIDEADGVIPQINFSSDGSSEVASLLCQNFNGSSTTCEETLLLLWEEESFPWDVVGLSSYFYGLENNMDFYHDVLHWSCVSSSNPICELVNSNENWELSSQPIWLEKYTVLSEWKRPESITTISFENGQNLEQVSTMEYNSNGEHLGVTATETTDSQGRIIRIESYYPTDFELDWTQEMVDYGQKASPLLIVSKNDGQITSAAFNKYQLNEHGKVLLKETYSLKNGVGFNQSDVDQLIATGQPGQQFLLDSSIETYTIHGSPRTVQYRGDINYAAVYGHGERLSIAYATNAKADEIGYTGIESDDLSAWGKDINAACISNEAFTGDHSFVIGGNLAADNMEYGPSQQFNPDDENGKYLFSFWYKTDASYADEAKAVLSLEDANGVITASWQGTTLSASPNEWTYFEVEYDLSAQSFTMGDDLRIRAYVWHTDYSAPDKAILIDELRFHPTDAQMKTFTHEELVGLKDGTAVNGLPAFFEYDEFGRLQFTLDHEKNILQRNDYHYNNQ